MAQEINFDRATMYTGRNGNGQCCGLDLDASASIVTLSPLNSKGMIANCRIEVPTEALPAIVAALQVYIAKGKAADA